ncbi:hypothetical protein ACFQ1I_09725 [Kitasatospora arboriphila]
METSIVAFRYRPAGLDGEELDRINRELPAAVQLRGRVFVTGAVLGGHEMLRACLLNATTTEADVRLLVDEVHAAAAGLTGRPDTSGPA